LFWKNIIIAKQNSTLNVITDIRYNLYCCW